LGQLPLVAEDLGIITEPVERLRDDLRLPGMVVLQFAFTADMKNPQSVGGDRRDRVIYTGTHDNPTTVQWWEEASELERDSARLAFAAASVDHLDPHWAMIELALRSPCYLSILPAQDLLGLGAAARMNTPGQETGNWTWRLEPDALTAELAERLLGATRAARRV
jgi:4-alpha-glucanotransferase